jgi:serine protease Do
MNHRNMWAILGMGALGVALVALPGSSRQKQEGQTKAAPDSGEENQAVEALPRAEFAQQLRLLKARAAELAAELQDANPKVRVYNELKDADGDDDLQVFVSTGGWLGVGVSEVSADTMKQLKLPEERGALLGKVVPESPAAKAGLHEKDVVLEINGQRVEGSEQFRRMIHEIPAGRTANLTIWRDGRTQTVKVTLAKPEMNNLKVFSGNPQSFAFKMPVMPDLSGLDHLRTFTMVSPGRPLLGIDAEDLEGEFGNYFGAPEGEGVLVRGVFGDSPAAKAGLKVGDVITSMNGERIRGASELREKLLTKRTEKTIKLGILRNKAELTVSVELPQYKEEHESFLSERTNI